MIMNLLVDKEIILTYLRDKNAMILVDFDMKKKEHVNARLKCVLENCTYDIPMLTFKFLLHQKYLTYSHKNSNPRDTKYTEFYTYQVEG